jgi:hypothetical protein
MMSLGGIKMKIINSILFSVIAVSFINVSQALDVSLPTMPQEPNAAECIPQSEMQVIARTFRQFANLANAPFCNDDSQNWHLLSSIMFMRQTKFAATMPVSKDELFTGRFASSWYDYFIGRITELEVVDSCQKGVIAYVYGFGGSTMYVCPMALTKTFSSLDRASVMMHEARHLDGFPHMMCSRGARKGISGACDVRISDGGSYAVTVETYAQLAKYAEGIHPAMKAYAKSSAVVYADEAFENPVRINRAEKLLVLTNSLDFYSLNPATAELKKLGKTAASGKIIRRGQHMIIIPTDKTLKAQYVFSNNEGEIDQSPSEMISEYNAKTPEQKANLVDIHVGAQWSAQVNKTAVTFTCDPRSPAKSELKLPAGKIAANLLYPNGYARDTYTVQLVTESGEVFDLSCLNKQASLKPSALKIDQKYARVNKANGQTIGLLDGKLFKIDGDRSSSLSTALDGSIVEIVTQQSFEFFAAE